MAAKKEGGGLLAILGGPMDEDSEEKESTPKGRAMKAMWDALQKGEFEQAGHHYETAYEICAAKHNDDEEESPLEGDEEAEY